MDPKTLIVDGLRELIHDIPGIAHVIRDWAGVKGLDLGPAPPDARAGVALVDANIDAQLEALKRRG